MSFYFLVCSAFEKLLSALESELWLCGSVLKMFMRNLLKNAGRTIDCAGSMRWRCLLEIIATQVMFMYRKGVCGLRNLGYS